MNLHNEIMNIQHEQSRPKSNSEYEGCTYHGYQLGHRDARHAAAELSLKYELLIDKLFSALDMHDIKRVDELKEEFGYDC